MTRDEADTLLNILYERLENGALDYIEDGTLEALNMAREALEQPNFKDVVETLSEFVIDYEDENGNSKRLLFNEAREELVAILAP